MQFFPRVALGQIKFENLFSSLFCWNYVTTPQTEELRSVFLIYFLSEYCCNNFLPIIHSKSSQSQQDSEYAW